MLLAFNPLYFQRFTCCTLFPQRFSATPFSVLVAATLLTNLRSAVCFYCPLLFQSLTRTLTRVFRRGWSTIPIHSSGKLFSPDLRIPGSMLPYPLNPALSTPYVADPFLRFGIHGIDRFCLFLLVTLSRFQLRSEGGLFKAKLSFPPDYPYMPPTMRFTSEMWHPNSMFCLVTYILFFLFIVAL